MSSRVPLWQRLIVGCLAILIGLLGGGFCGGGVAYSVSERLRIGGFPIPAYCWERLDSGGWVDFISPLTFPIMTIDFLLGFCICAAMVWWLGRLWGRKVRRT
jgi:hypothetical protein